MATRADVTSNPGAPIPYVEREVGSAQAPHNTAVGQSRRGRTNARPTTIGFIILALGVVGVIFGPQVALALAIGMVVVAVLVVRHDMILLNLHNIPPP